ncbi:hypothetical protein H0X10_01265 [Candidatus Saccharibacteria bacterium]|nr:hypothetical protein [Candidatus Saccharibacteria bacterium]
MSAWEKPDFGEPDRAHFEFEKFTSFGQELEQEVAELRAAVGSEPYVGRPKEAKVPELLSERQQKIADASTFLSTLDLSLAVAS